MSLDLSALYLLHRRELINRLLRIVRCRETAQDIVQESYIILARNMDVQAIEQPRGFLYRTATNLALDHLRHEKVVENYAQALAPILPTEHPSTEHQFAEKQGAERLRQAIRELPPRCRDVFILHKIKGFSYREVAEMLGITQSAVEKHIIKGLLHCRHALKHNRSGKTGGN